MEHVSDITELISLNDFMGEIDDGSYDLSSQSDLKVISKSLKKLNNHKSFLLDFIWDDLKNVERFQSANRYGPNVVMLHDRPEFFLRANIWRPLTKIEKSLPNFEYDVCHDHNFDILTSGYFGPGYQSRTYTYDSGEIVGKVGEHVELGAPEIFTLSEGRVALYRRHEDVHIQLPPESLSISLNLIPRGEHFNNPQFQFDEINSSIKKYLNCRAIDIFVRMAGSLGDEAMIEPLLYIAKNTTHSHLKVFSLASIIRIDKSLEKGIGKHTNNFTDLEKHLFESELRKFHN